MTEPAKLTLAMLSDVEVELTVVLGKTQARVADVLAYAPGAVVRLDAHADAPATLLVNGVAIARGEIVTTEEGALAVEIHDLLEPLRTGESE